MKNFKKTIISAILLVSPVFAFAETEIQVEIDELKAQLTKLSQLSPEDDIREIKATFNELDISRLMEISPTLPPEEAAELDSLLSSTPQVDKLFEEAISKNPDILVALDTSEIASDGFDIEEYFNSSCEAGNVLDVISKDAKERYHQACLYYTITAVAQKTLIDAEKEYQDTCGLLLKDFDIGEEVLNSALVGADEGTSVRDLLCVASRAQEVSIEKKGLFSTRYEVTAEFSASEFDIMPAKPSQDIDIESLSVQSATEVFKLRRKSFSEDDVRVNLIEEYPDQFTKRLYSYGQEILSLHYPYIQGSAKVDYVLTYDKDLKQWQVSELKTSTSGDMSDKSHQAKAQCARIPLLNECKM